MSNKQRTHTGWAGGLNELESKTLLSSPPQRAFRSNGGQTVFEDQVLVGYVVAPKSAREALDHYGIDISYAHFDPLQRRWVGCFFSENVADMLVALATEGQCPFAFEAVPSWAELDWRVRQSRGETSRPKLAVYLYCEPASAEAIEAWRRRTGENLVWRVPPKAEEAAPAAGVPSSVWIWSRSRRQDDRGEA